MLRRNSGMAQQLSHRRSDVRRALDQHLGHLVEAFRRADLVDRELDGGFIGGVEDVVDRARKSEEIFAVKWRRVCVRQLVDQNPSLRVALALDRLHLVDELAIAAGSAAELLYDLKGA